MISHGGLALRYLGRLKRKAPALVGVSHGVSAGFRERRRDWFDARVPLRILVRAWRELPHEERLRDFPVQ